MEEEPNLKSDSVIPNVNVMDRVREIDAETEVKNCYTGTSIGIDFIAAFILYKYFPQINVHRLYSECTNSLYNTLVPLKNPLVGEIQSNRSYMGAGGLNEDEVFNYSKSGKEKFTELFEILYKKYKIKNHVTREIFEKLDNLDLDVQLDNRKFPDDYEKVLTKLVVAPDSAARFASYRNFVQAQKSEVVYVIGNLNPEQNQHAPGGLTRAVGSAMELEKDIYLYHLNTNSMKIQDTDIPEALYNPGAEGWYQWKHGQPYFTKCKADTDVPSIAGITNFAIVGVTQYLGVKNVQEVVYKIFKKILDLEKHQKKEEIKEDLNKLHDIFSDRFTGTSDMLSGGKKKSRKSKKSRKPKKSRKAKKSRKVKKSRKARKSRKQRK